MTDDKKPSEEKAFEKCQIGDRLSWIDGGGTETLATVIHIPRKEIIVELDVPSKWRLTIEDTTPVVRDNCIRIISPVKQENIRLSAAQQEEWNITAEKYIRANVVPNNLRLAITDMLLKVQPNIMHLCAKDALWSQGNCKDAALDALDVFKHELDIEYEDKGGAMVWSNSLEALARAKAEIRRRYE